MQSSAVKAVSVNGDTLDFTLATGETFRTVAPAGYVTANAAFIPDLAKKQVRIEVQTKIHFPSSSVSVNTLAHELTHGVVQFTAALRYSKQSGALNESWADAMGTVVKQWAADQTVTDADWLIGKGILGSQMQGAAPTPAGRSRPAIRLGSVSRRSTNENSRWPTLSRADQRLSDAITSLVVTGEPSWNFKPSRKVKV